MRSVPVKKTLLVLLFGVIVGGALGFSKKSDADVLTRVGKTSSRKVTAAMPPIHQLAGPLAATKTGDLLPIEDRVRLRFQTDKALDGSNITVIADGQEVKLRGEVANALVRARAVELAQTTSGVEKVTNELVEPLK